MIRPVEPAPFSGRELCDRLADAIAAVARDLPEVRLMEVCGTHTAAFFRTGVRGRLPGNIRLLSGPGCPVCVTPTPVLDLALRLLEEPDTAIVTFGDMLRVPGSRSSLERERARGRRVHVVYSPLDALDRARATPRTRFIFLGVGFETTAPTVARLITQAEKEGIENLWLLSAHKLVPPALDALLCREDVSLDGLILPGHVSVVIGSDAYGFLVEEHAMPGVIAGFEAADLLRCVLDLLLMRLRGEARIENRYARCVAPGGNRAAREILARVFVPEASEWRGLGTIPASGLALAPDLAHRDALGLLDAGERTRIGEAADEPPGCRCGEVLCGAAAPGECPLFGSACTPESPVGACMVSSEGTCAAFFQHGELR